MTPTRPEKRPLARFLGLGLVLGTVVGFGLPPAMARAEPPKAPLLLQDFGGQGEQARLVAAFAAHERRHLALQGATGPWPSDESAARTLRAADALLRDAGS